MSEALESAVTMRGIAEVDDWKNFHKARYEAALRAATLRIEFLRRWPNAFEQHDGTFGH